MRDGHADNISDLLSQWPFSSRLATCNCFTVRRSHFCQGQKIKNKWLIERRWWAVTGAKALLWCPHPQKPRVRRYYIQNRIRSIDRSLVFCWCHCRFCYQFGVALSLGRRSVSHCRRASSFPLSKSPSQPTTTNSQCYFLLIPCSGSMKSPH